MKKILAMLLVALLVLSMGAALAETYNNNNQDLSENIGKITSFTKKFTAQNDGTTPAATFSFTVTDPTAYTNNEGNTADVTTVPTVTIGTDGNIDFDEGTGSNDVAVGVTVGDAPLGVYTYTITEEEPNIAGVTIAEPFYLVVTVLRDETNGKHYVAAMHLESATGTKKAEIENKYESGSLEVSKKVTGNMADQSKYFKFNVTFTPDTGDTIASTIGVNLNGAAAEKKDTEDDIKEGDGYTVSNNTYTFYLKHDDKVTFENVPAGVTYSVSEVPESYTQLDTAYTSNDTANKIDAGKTDKAEFTNELKTTVDTGITLETLPYILVLAVVIAGAALMIIRRRRNSDD